jgi:hypothetical protein
MPVISATAGNINSRIATYASLSKKQDHISKNDKSKKELEVWLKP